MFAPFVSDLRLGVVYTEFVPLPDDNQLDGLVSVVEHTWYTKIKKDSVEGRSVLYSMYLTEGPQASSINVLSVSVYTVAVLKSFKRKVNESGRLGACLRCDEVRLERALRDRSGLVEWLVNG